MILDETVFAGDNQSTKYSANTDTSYYSLPRVPAVPARRPKYGIVPLT